MGINLEKEVKIQLIIEKELGINLDEEVMIENIIENKKHLNEKKLSQRDDRIACPSITL